MRTSPVDMEFHYSDRFGEHVLPEAYERLLLDAVQRDIDIVVPSVDGHFQPLCAVYSKRCIPAIERQLDNGDYKIIRCVLLKH